MAWMIQNSEPTVTSINNFLGLNMNLTGDTQLKLGEASKMQNFRITKNYKLQKMDGYKKIYQQNGKIRAQWVGILGDKNVHVYVCGGKIYNKEEEIGTLTDDVTSIFEFNQKLYFLNGHEYKSWNGTELVDVEGYIPLIEVAMTPSGTGEVLEGLNVLTNKRRVTFSGDGEATTYQLPEKAITTLIEVKINGEVVELPTLSQSAGKMIFSSAPARGTDNIEVTYSKKSNTRSLVLNNKYFQKYGLANDTRVFLFGNDEAKNRIIFSDLDNTGVPNVEYFPATNFIDVGSSNVAVTDIARQYDRLIICKENETYYANYDMITDSTGETIIAFPTYPLNSSHGMVAKGQHQLLDNYVTTIDSSIVQWTNTNTKDERNATIVSERVQEWLNEKDLSNAITMDYQELKEYWLAIDNEVMIYNYGNSTFYLLKLADNLSSMVNSNGVIYLGTENGEIMEINSRYTTYNGKRIDAEWQSGFYDFEVEYKKKTMRVLWLTLKPHSRTAVNVNYLSDRDSGTDEKEIKSVSMDFRNVNFNDFSFNVNETVKPYRIKLKAKKFAFLKLILKNDKLDSYLTVDSLSIKKTYGSEVK